MINREWTCGTRKGMWHPGKGICPFPGCQTPFRVPQVHSRLIITGHQRLVINSDFPKPVGHSRLIINGFPKSVFPKPIFFPKSVFQNRFFSKIGQNQPKIGQCNKYFLFRFALFLLSGFDVCPRNPGAARFSIGMWHPEGHKTPKTVKNQPRMAKA